MAMNLVTGYAGSAHITAEADGALNAGIVGKGRYVLDLADKFSYEILSNNSIKIKSGYALDQGRLMELAVNNTETLAIDNGLQNVKRCDLICIRYQKNASTGVETCEMEVVKGTSGDDYADPTLTSGNILTGAAIDEMPLWRVKINGLSIEAVEQLFELRASLSDTAKIKTYGSLEDLGATTNDGISSLISMMENKSMLVTNVVSGDNAFYNSLPSGAGAGALMIMKTGSDSGRSYAQFTKYTTGDVWMNAYYNNAFIGWNKLLNEKDLPKIQNGVKDIAVTTSAQNLTITFPEAFKEVPSVQITLASSNATTEPYNVDYFIKSVSKTKAVVSFKARTNYSEPAALHWLALGNF